MAPSFNVYWTTAVDFRNFDISVPRFNFLDDNFRSVPALYGPVALADEIRLIAASGAATNDSFLGLSVTSSGQTITGGTLNMYVDWGSGGINGYIEVTVSLLMTDINSVIDTPSTTDDIAFLRQMLGGDDAIELSGGPGGTATNDYVFAAAGNDQVYGNKGNDTLLGDGGNDDVSGDDGADSVLGGTGSDFVSGNIGADKLFGGRGRDSLYGGDQNDEMHGGAGADEFYGGNGKDTLWGEGGNDSLDGGAGGDVFVFRRDHGNDTITGWTDGVDKIRLEPTANINVNINYSGPNALITIAAMNITILVENVANNSLQLTGDGGVFFLA